MDTTIRNLDEEAYRVLKAQAALQGLSIGEAMTEAIWAYVRDKRGPEAPNFWDIEPWDFGRGTERLSEEIDDIVYGHRDA